MGEYIFCTEQSIEVAEMTPYIKLWIDVFGLREGGFKSRKNTVKNIEKLTNRILETLTARERDILTARYGLDESKELHTLEEIGEMYDLSGEMVRQIEAKAFRKLRHPSRSGVIRGTQAYKADDYSWYSDIDYKLRLKNILFEEIKHLIDGQIKKTVFLDNILQKNHINIVEQNDKIIAAANIGLEEMKIGVRTYNCLKRAGKNNLQDLLDMSDIDLMTVRNFGRKSYEEVKENIEDFNNKYCQSDFYTLEVIKNNEKIIYKYLSEDNEKIAQSLLSMIIYDEKKGENIFWCACSPGLLEILLMKGYVFIQDVINDSKLLINQLSNAGFESFASEIREMSNPRTTQSSDDETAYIGLFSDHVIDFVKANSGSSIVEIRNMKEEIDDEEIVNFINDVSAALGVE